MTESRWFRLAVTAAATLACAAVVAAALSTVGESRRDDRLFEEEGRLRLIPLGESEDFTPLLTARTLPELEIVPYPQNTLQRSVDERVEELHSWVLDVAEGATSRGELVEMCAEVPEGGFGAQDPPDSPSEDLAWVRTEDRWLAEFCREVRKAPESRTLREWADLIEERFGPPPDYIDYGDSDFGE